jgi:hypothetical protein
MKLINAARRCALCALALLNNSQSTLVCALLLADPTAWPGQLPLRPATQSGDLPLKQSGDLPDWACTPCSTASKASPKHAVFMPAFLGCCGRLRLQALVER